MPESPYVEELRLISFKSFRDARLPLDDLTLLIGRNGSGKSNAIDGLHVLARMALGEDLRDAIDGSRRDGSEVRGGARGCAPHGESSFKLGCTVVVGRDRLRLDVAVQVEPDVQILSEELQLEPASGARRTYLRTDPPQPGLVDIRARHYNGRKGRNPVVGFRSDRLLTAQVPVKIGGSSKAVREVHRAAQAVVDALRTVFILDPVPAMMRHYVPSGDTVLRRRAENLSAVVGALRSDPGRWNQLRDLMQALPEQQVAEIDVERSPLDDVMLVVRERFADVDVPFSARVMSDGMLRFLAFAAALLESPRIDEADDGSANTLLVIEELENGLHPSLAARIVELIKTESKVRRIRTLATTHSPAMLSALQADDHRGVLVCRRDPATARSELIPLVELPRYPQALAAGSLGEAVTQRRLDGEDDPSERRRALDELLSTI